ncbi:hypothetical protein F5B22DRAFT_652313 [Xylaria bambusicola]|uniref:uncharacterized protein n=1 Tax=Xylaria bambusicola TaxID=326684 RepID=UPI002007CE44|nr:uncharacterized protein F5B22DRAFT_652313 [Xylaria bambusicola]KAI0503167.1 hypothetical protein F5B22DRAFT_652313 [Xylaria bambusicola]
MCPAPLAAVLDGDHSSILRDTTLAEDNAYTCLRALESLPEALKTRAAAGKLYLQLLAEIPGIRFQQIPNGPGTNYYQVSFTVNVKCFGLNAKQLYNVLETGNIHCGANGMPCVATGARFSPHSRVDSDTEHSRLLATTSVTLPISNRITLSTVRVICELVKLIHLRAGDLFNIGLKGPGDVPTHINKPANIIDLESKFRQCLIMPVLDDASRYTKVIDRWSRGECVVVELHIDSIVGTLVILGSKNTGQYAGNSSRVALDESGSSASVALVANADGKLTVQKSAAGYGIDGNGAPWLRRQPIFLNSSQAVKTTDMFVVPIEVNDSGTAVNLVLPYVPSHSFGELVFANVGIEPLVAVMVNMLAKMTSSVWTEGQEVANPCFIQKAHFNRMRRRVEIARAQDEGLDKILNQKTVRLNGKQLLEFEVIMEKLEKHPALGGIRSEDSEDVALNIDPRGVPLLGDDSQKMFERGDYCYDVSKLLFSLTGFSEIRKPLFEYSTDGDSHSLMIKQHPGSDTMSGTAHLLLPRLAMNKMNNLRVQDSERESVDFGVAMIQHTLLQPQMCPYDVLEISVKAESAPVAQKLLRDMVGTYFPTGTVAHLSTDPFEHFWDRPGCLAIIHPFNGVRGQTHMLVAATRRTNAFFRDAGASQSFIDNLRIVHISTGSSSRSQLTARANDKLLSPGSFGILPLQLAAMQTAQLPFPRPGRWVIENDSFFLLSRPLTMSGDNICLLAVKRPASESSSS